MWRNGKRKESLKDGARWRDYYALVYPEWYFLFLIEPLQVLQAAQWVSRPALTGRPGLAWPRSNCGRQDRAHGSACPQLPRSVCVGFPPSAAAGMASTARPHQRLRQHTQVSGDLSSTDVSEGRRCCCLQSDSAPLCREHQHISQPVKHLLLILIDLTKSFHRHCLRGEAAAAFKGNNVHHWCETSQTGV